MEEQNKRKAAAAELRKNLDELSSKGRFTVPDRVNHIRRLQKKDGVEIYAIQCVISIISITFYYLKYNFEYTI